MENIILRQIGTISRSLDSISNVEFSQFDLAKGQYLYLVRIMENPGIIQHRLAQLLCVDKTTANRAINKLEKKGLVFKKETRKNKKEQLLYVTPEGAALYPLIIRENEFSTQVALEGITTEERQQLVVLLSKMAENTSKDSLAVKSGKQRNY